MHQSGISSSRHVPHKLSMTVALKHEVGARGHVTGRGFFVWPGCSGFPCPRPAPASQRRDSDSPHGLRPLPRPCDKGSFSRSRQGSNACVRRAYKDVCPGLARSRIAQRIFAEHILEKDIIAVRPTPDIKMIAIASPQYLAHHGEPRASRSSNSTPSTRRGTGIAARLTEK
jgi:hypothetical protein